MATKKRAKTSEYVRVHDRPMTDAEDRRIRAKAVRGGKRMAKGVKRLGAKQSAKVVGDWNQSIDDAVRSGKTKIRNCADIMREQQAEIRAKKTEKVCSVCARSMSDDECGDELPSERVCEGCASKKN